MAQLENATDNDFACKRYVIDIYTTFEKRQEIPKGKPVYLVSQGRRSLPRETRLTGFPVGISCLFSKVVYVSFTYRCFNFKIWDSKIAT